MARLRLGPSRPAPDAFQPETRTPWEQLAHLDAKIERALDLAIDLGDVDAAKVKLRALRAERETVLQELTHARMDLPTAEELMPRLREKLRELEKTLRADPALGRLALGARAAVARSAHPRARTPAAPVALGVPAMRALRALSPLQHHPNPHNAAHA